MRALFWTLGRITPALAARWAHYLWYRPTRYPLSAKEFAQLRRARSLPLTHAERPVSAYVWGDGPAVLLVHGWGGRGIQLGSFVSPLVDAGYRVITFDAPAHGRSTGRATTLPEVTDVIQQLAQHHGPLHAVVAHSFGVLCALYAAGQGMPVRRFVAISPPATIEGLVVKFSDNLKLPRRAIKPLRALLERRFGADLWLRFSAIHMARGLQLTALVIHDRDDREIPWQEGAALAESWSGAALSLTEGLGHRRLLNDPRVVARAVDFIGAPPPA